MANDWVVKGFVVVDDQVVTLASVATAVRQAASLGLDSLHRKAT